MNVADSQSNAIAAYTLGADGERVRKDLAGGAWKEYVGGVSELSSTDGWTDYIYANGTKIARVAENVPMLHFSGTNPQSGVECGALVDVGLNYSVQAGDMLSWMEYKNNAVGGLAEFFNGGVLANPWRATDTNGITINQDSRDGVWVPRTYDLSAYAGTSLTALTTLKDVTTPAGSWDIWYADIAIVSPATGTVTTVMGSTGQVAAYGAECQGPYSAVNIALENPGMAPAIVGTGVDTHFYVGDHLGSAQLEFAAGGWPVWQGQYAPFGQEMDTQNTANNYRFTGLEYDSLSELDHATFRQFSPVTTRWMSADPFGGSMDPSNPQSLNRYSYVENMPMISRDPTGLDWEGTIGTIGVSLGGCLGAAESAGGNIVADIGCAWSIFENFFGFGGKNKTWESEKPRPGAIWDEHGSYQAKPYTSAGDILGLTGPGCEFGACGSSLTDNDQKQTASQLQQALDEVTSGRVAGLLNIKNHSCGGCKYDYGWNSRSADTWNVCGRTFNADQFGNFMAGYQAGAYDKNYFWTTGAIWAQGSVDVAGVLYHLTGRTKATSDPLDRTGMPDILRGQRYARHGCSAM